MKNNSITIPQKKLSYSSPYKLKISSRNPLINNAILIGVFKVDTGCTVTSIGVADQFSTDRLISLKKKDIALFRNKRIVAYRSYGVYDNNIRNDLINRNKSNLNLCTDEELLEDPRICFLHETEHLFLNEVDFGSVKFGINYNRQGNDLLGVTFLKDCLVHLYPFEDISYLKISKVNRGGLLEKVREKVRLSWNLGDIVEYLESEGYEESDINSTLVEVLKNTYATPGTID